VQQSKNFNQIEWAEAVLKHLLYIWQLQETLSGYILIFTYYLFRNVICSLDFVIKL